MTYIKSITDFHKGQMDVITSCISGKEEVDAEKTLLEEHADECDDSSVDADGTCKMCGKTDLL
jgi:hypothetical protein